MSVSRADVRSPAPFATASRLSARSIAASREAATAPLPTFTSTTSASTRAASFFERIDAVISGTESTVAVTSRTA